MSRVAVAALILLSVTILQAQGLDPTPVKTEPGPADPPLREDELTSKKILEQIVEKSKKGQKLTVDRARAALCPVCKQPLYKHSDPNFRCEPPPEYRNGRLVRAPIKPTESVALRCPVCRSSFKAFKQGNINDKAGRDRDFCPHSVGKYTIHSSVWMCPDCGYAMDADFFGKPNAVTPEIASFVQTKLKAKTRAMITELAGLREREGRPVPPEQLRFGSYIDQPMIPDWAKYENALAIVEAGLVKLPHGVKARIYCEAAHACRRFVAGELNIPLEDQRLQITLGQSARRVNDWLLAECLKVREKRGDIKDEDARFTERLRAYTQEAETEPQILRAAAALLDRKIQEILRLESRENGPEKRTRVTRMDQYVFHMRYGGILDRTGNLEEAAAQFEKARLSIPPEPPQTDDPNSAAAQEFVAGLLNSLRNAATKRTELINKEREFLFKAARHLLQALYFGERADNLDPAMNCYLIGELLRRGKGEPAAALACFKAAKELFSRIDPTKVTPKIPDGTPKAVAQQYVSNAQKRAQKKKDVMLSWTEDQMALVKEKAAGREPDSRVRDTIARLLSGRIGEPAISATRPDIRIPETRPGPATTNPNDKDPIAASKKDPVPPAPVPSGLTREAVYKSYFAAIKAYESKNGALPRRLKELVTAGVLKPASACLNEKGSLICPETGNPLIYLKPPGLGSHTKMIIPIGKDPNRMALFADGKVGTE